MRNRPFPSCCEPHYESEAKCKAFQHMKINFACMWMKTNFHNKNFALSLAFIMGFRGLGNGLLYDVDSDWVLATSFSSSLIFHEEKTKWNGLPWRRFGKVILGRFPFVRTGQPDRSVCKWSVPIWRTDASNSSKWHIPRVVCAILQQFIRTCIASLVG